MVGVAVVMAVVAAASLAAAPTATSATASRPSPVLPPVTGEALAHTCSGCHGTQGRLADEAFAPLAGMPAAGFVQTMQDFRSGRRPATLMGHIARGLNDAEFQAMAEYFARQTPAPGSAAALNPLRSVQPGASR